MSMHRTQLQCSRHTGTDGKYFNAICTKHTGVLGKFLAGENPHSHRNRHTATRQTKEELMGRGQKANVTERGFFLD